MIISVEVSNSIGIRRFKAPKGTLYEIFDIHFTVITAQGVQALVVNYLAEEERTFLDRTNQEGILAIMDASIAGQAEDFSFSKGEKTKFITVALDSVAGSTSVFVVIHYQLINATRTELLLEWFRKGR